MPDVTAIAEDHAPDVVFPGATVSDVDRVASLGGVMCQDNGYRGCELQHLSL